MPYSLYLRKSRADLDAEARGEGETLARHEKILLDLAKRLKLNITEIYREIVSGETIAARPVMQQLLTEVEQGLWEGVLVVEIERLARGATIDQGIIAQTFKYSNTKIITPMKTYDPNNDLDEDFFEFGLFMSRREYKTINRRLQTGRIQSVKEGKWLGTKPPYGYRRRKLEKQKGFTLEVVPEEAETVKLIFELYTQDDRQGVSLICRRLNGLKISPAKGDVWVPASIRGILSNPVYIGKVRWNSRPTKKMMVDGRMVRERPRAKLEDWMVVDGLHPAIVETETFNLAQKHLSDNPPHRCPKDLPLRNPLAGLIVCGVCGRKMVRRPYSKKDLPEALMCPSTACQNISTHLSFVEERLLEALESWLNEYKLQWGSQENSRRQGKNRQEDLKRKAVKKLDDELKNLEKQMENIHDLLEQGIYSTDTFLERSRIISGKLGTAKQERQKLNDELHQDKLRDESQKVIIPKVERILKLYREADDPAAKNELLREIVAKAVYLKTAKSHRTRPGVNDFQLTLYPKMPVSLKNDN